MEIKKLVQDLLSAAIARRASDVFILPSAASFKVKMRTELGLATWQELDKRTGNDLLNYLKFSAQMDLAEHRRPQIGAWMYQVDQQIINLRFSCLGDYRNRESLVMRIIYASQNNRYFLPNQLQQLTNLANQRGMIITSGPTGSGKTSLMYDLARLLSASKMTMTIEDPVEIQEDGFLQAQVNAEAGMTYPNLLKAALRHRPDILIIGEIRDRTSAKIAVNAALSGHLVLATVHAKSTLQTISRLTGLGIEPGKLRNCLTAVSYQRLLPDCEGRLACLLDIACQSDWHEEGTFVSWQEHLTDLQAKEKIDAATKEAFWYG
ncbi:MAG: Flp pilus assembly complex ATPase component TadA [Lactobacillus sp.]|nr:Flp pilus assembly complex ATPase component TadA [Lactobacillus sp.]